MTPRPAVKNIADLAGKRFARVMLRPIVPVPRGSNISIIHDHLPKNSELPAVMHRKTTELVFCLKGRLVVVLGRRRRRLKPGDIVWIPPGTWHRFISGRSAVDCLSIFCPPLKLTGKSDVCVR